MTTDLPTAQADEAQPDAPIAEPAAGATAPRITRRRRLTGALLLLLSLGVSLLLTAEQFDRLRLPGCAVESPCGALTAGRWAKFPFWEDASYRWPVSFLGVAFFAGLLAAWLLAPRTGVPSVLRWLARLGAAGSLGFAAIMYWEKTFCAYCSAVHAGNLAFWIVAETTVKAGSFRRPLMAFVCTAVAISAALGWGETRRRKQIEQEGNARLEASIAEVIEVSRGQPQKAPGQAAFRGRYVRGPAEAPLRLVIFTDYQCVHCREWDRQLAVALAEYDSVAFSIRHFPVCPDCNPRVPKEQKAHANACRAAWAAEAAGLLGGNEGFWAMHGWLFQRGGQFTDEQLTAALGALGFDDAAKFSAVMNSATVRALIEHDVREAHQVGLRGTPMLFVNGVELAGLSSVASLRDMLARLQAADLPPRTAAFDRPPLLADTFYDQWQEQPIVDIPRGRCRWHLGPEDATVRVVLFLDCQRSLSAQVAAVARDWAAKRSDVRAEFYHYPFSVEAHGPHRLVEAAGRVGGAEAFWRMHDWFCQQGEDGTAEKGLAAAESLQLDREKLSAEFDREATTQAVDDDIQLGVLCNADGAPRIYINGRLVRQIDPNDLIERILAEPETAN